MADSDRTNDDYARSTKVAPTIAATPAAATRKRWQRLRPYFRARFRPRLWPTLAAAALVPLFICAGQWQWDKAAGKARLQAQLDAQRAEPAVQTPQALADSASLAALRYRTIVATGRYEPERQILIDNRTLHGQGGYHVVTPLRVAGSEVRLLVNRGWIPAPADHSRVPEFTTPAASVEISGTAIVPPARFFTLSSDNPASSPGWQRVWQNLDLKTYALAAGFPIQPFVVELDANSAAGGFAREWRAPDDKRQTNLAYAFQWWSFAAITVVLWLVLNFRRSSRGIDS